jgi:hypothetical protein
VSHGPNIAATPSKKTWLLLLASRQNTRRQTARFVCLLPVKLLIAVAQQLLLQG